MLSDDKITKIYCMADYICEHCSYLFSKLLSYNRFVELEKEVLFGLVLRFQAPPDHKREGGSTQLHVHSRRR